MTTKTQDELVDEALRKLMVVGSGQSPDAEDQELVDGKVGTLIDQLSADGIVTISDPDVIRGEFFDALASLLANLCAPDFGKSFSLDAVKYYEGRLTRTTAVSGTSEPLKVDYF